MNNNPLKLPPVVAVNNSITFMSKRLPELIKKYDQGNSYDFFRRIMIKRLGSVTGELESAKSWAKDTVGKEIEEIKNIKKNLKKNKKVINEKSKEVYDKAKEESKIIKDGIALKIKYIYLKASEGEINIPFDDAATIKKSERLIDTFDIKKARNARKLAFKMAKEIVTQKNEPQGTKPNINTDVDTGANTSAYFGATLGKRLEMFDNTKKTYYNTILSIFFFSLAILFLYKANKMI